MYKTIQQLGKRDLFCDEKYCWTHSNSGNRFAVFSHSSPTSFSRALCISPSLYSAKSRFLSPSALSSLSCTGRIHLHVVHQQGLQLRQQQLPLLLLPFPPTGLGSPLCSTCDRICYRSASFCLSSAFFFPPSSRPHPASPLPPSSPSSPRYIRHHELVLVLRDRQP